MIVMKITIDNNRFMQLEAAPEDLDKIDEFFTYQDYSECFVYGQFRKEKIKNRKTLIRKKKYPTVALLPIGFRQDLEIWLKRHKAKYKFFDTRKHYGKLFPIWNTTEDKEEILSDADIAESLGYLTLYPYQVDSVKTCLNQGSGIIKIPTSGGKTEIFISLCKLTNIPTLILFSRIALAQQTKKRMIAAGLDAGIVQGKNIDENHMVVMATVQSFHKLKRNDYKIVIVDEVHNVKADQYQEALRSNVFRYRFGFSATPLDPKPAAKWKNAQVKMWIGGIIHTVRPEELLDNGTVAKPTIHVWEMTKPILDDDGQWQYAENQGIVKNTYRNKFIARLTNSLTGQRLLLCKRIEQGEELQKMIPGSIFLFGNIDDKIRQDVVSRFDSGEDFVLIASTIFDEGISIDSINHVILAGGGASFVKILQRVGRGMRLLKDDKGEIIKNTVDIHDFLDDTHRILRKHSKDRIKIYYDYGYKNIIEHDKKEVEELMQ